jgi:SAM-dependent methyltransferase
MNPNENSCIKFILLSCAAGFTLRMFVKSMLNSLKAGQQDGWPTADAGFLGTVLPITQSGAAGALSIPDLSFSHKYTTDHAQRYYEKHEQSLARRLSHRREVWMARRALELAGNPRSVLDLPCGTGRFWELLAEQPGRTILGADLSEPMLETALRVRRQDLLHRVQVLQASAFSVPRPENFVECVFCMRLLHHMKESEHRLLLLKELARVSSDSIVISLWLDGNYKAWRWRVKDRRQGHRNRFMIPRRVIEAEIAQSGLRIAGRIDFLRFYSMWSTYVLRKS